MSRFWEIVFCVPLLFHHHVCLSNLKHLPLRKLPLTSHITVFRHLKALKKFFQHPSAIFMSIAKTTWIQINSPGLKKMSYPLLLFLFVTSSSITQCQMQLLTLPGICNGCVFKFVCVCVCVLCLFCRHVHLICTQMDCIVPFKWKPRTCSSKV